MTILLFICLLSATLTSDFRLRIKENLKFKNDWLVYLIDRAAHLLITWHAHTNSMLWESNPRMPALLPGRSWFLWFTEWMRNSHKPLLPPGTHAHAHSSLPVETSENNSLQSAPIFIWTEVSSDVSQHVTFLSFYFIQGIKQNLQLYCWFPCCPIIPCTTISILQTEAPNKKHIYLLNNTVVPQVACAAFISTSSPAAFFFFKTIH